MFTDQARQFCPTQQAIIYQTCGDNPGSINFLAKLADGLAEDAKKDELVTLSDMYIDLGVKDVANRDDYFTMAQENLKLVVGLADDVINGKTWDNRSMLASEAASAMLRIAELQTWRKAAEREPTTLNYPEYLSAAAASVAYMKHSDQVDSTLKEFIPVLLGARSEYLSIEPGWIGRLALRREDKRLRMKPGKNPNWDCAIMDDTRPKIFIRPTRESRLQIKSKNKTHRGRYLAAGIKVVSSFAAEFYDPAAIINECVREFDNGSHTTATTLTDQAHGNIAAIMKRSVD